MNIAIISGGAISDTLASCFIEREHPLVIAADCGVECLTRIGVKPDYIIGDFDSATEEAKSSLRKWPVPVTVLPTHKDDTDTEAALALALLLDRRNWEGLPESERYIIDAEGLPEGVGTYEVDSIAILGATGTRLDHVLGSISVLGQSLLARGGEGIPAEIIDPNNRIRLVDAKHPLTIPEEEQYGKYLSVIPFTTECTGVTLSGVEYPLTDAKMGGFTSLGISNEVRGCAHISLREGVLIAVESRD